MRYLESKSQKVQWRLSEDGRVKNGKLVFNKYEVSVLQDKAVWQVNGGDGCRVDVLCVADYFQMVKVVSVW